VCEMIGGLPLVQTVWVGDQACESSYELSVLHAIPAGKSLHPDGDWVL
jgi:hypothetical protein